MMSRRQEHHKTTEHNKNNHDASSHIVASCCDMVRRDTYDDKFELQDALARAAYAKLGCYSCPNTTLTPPCTECGLRICEYCIQCNCRDKDEDNDWDLTSCPPLPGKRPTRPQRRVQNTGGNHSARPCKQQGQCSHIMFLMTSAALSLSCLRPPRVPRQLPTQ